MEKTQEAVTKGWLAKLNVPPTDGVRVSRGFVLVQWDQPRPRDEYSEFDVNEVATAVSK